MFKKSKDKELKKPKTLKKTKKEIQSFKKDVDTDNHKISIEELLDRLGTDQNTVSCISILLKCNKYEFKKSN